MGGQFENTVCTFLHLYLRGDEAVRRVEGLCGQIAEQGLGEGPDG